MSLPDHDDLFDIAEREILASNPDIDPIEIRRQGSDAFFICESAAIMGDDLSNRLIEELAKLFKNTAEGEALNQWAWDHYRLARFLKCASRGHLSFYRNVISYGQVDIPKGTVCTDREGKEYETIEAARLTGYGPVNVQAVSRTTGALANLKAGGIKAIATKLDDPEIKVTNAIALPRFTRSAGDSGTIPSGTELTDLYGNSYLTGQALAFEESTTCAFVPVSLVAGHGFNAPAETNTINAVTDSLFDTFTISNPVKTGGAFSGGDDDEKDEDFNNRMDLFFLAARRGTDAAILMGAYSVDGVRRAQVAVEETEGVPALAVHVLVSDVNGIGNAALTSAVKAALPEYSCAGIPVFVSGGEIDFVDETLKLQAALDADTDALEELITNVMKNCFNRKPPSTGRADTENQGRVLVSEIIGDLTEIEKLHVPYDACQSPSTDYTPEWGHSARLGTLTINWV